MLSKVSKAVLLSRSDRRAFLSRGGVENTRGGQRPVIY